MKSHNSKKSVPNQSEQALLQVELIQPAVWDIDEYLRDLEENSSSQANDYLSLLSASSWKIHLEIDINVHERLYLKLLFR
jgi:hypothetical protein